MKKLLLLSILFMFNYSIFGQSKPINDTIKTKDSGLHFTPKIGYGRIWESGNGPLYGFVFGADLLYAIKLADDSYLETGLGGYEFAGNITYNGNTATLRNEYLQIPLKLKIYETIYEDKSKKQRLQRVISVGLYVNNLLEQKKEGVSVNNSAIYLGWNTGFTWNYGLKYTLSDKLNIESGFNYQFDFSKMNKNGVQRKMDYILAWYFEFKFF